MKEIEFRVWDKFNGQYWYSENYKSLSKFFEAMEHLIEGGNELIFERPTGLKDKKEVKIFEGDIVKLIYIPLGVNPSVYEYSKIGVIEYQYNQFGLTYKFECGKQLKPELCASHQRNYQEIYKHPSKGENWFDSHISFSKLEVIGNIHQNTELLINKPNT